MGSSDPVVALLPAAAALAVALTVARRPLAAFGVLFLVASLSRATLETPLGTMRPEMPAVAVATVGLLLTRGPRQLLTVPRPARGVVLGFLVYLAAILSSSILVASDRRQSLMMVAWLATSMAAGWLAFHLVRSRPVSTLGPLSLAGAVMGALGIGAAVVFRVAGPDVAPGIQDPASMLPRVYGLAWETNLYASFLAIVSFFALELARRRPGAPAYTALVLVLIGFPLGITRGAYIALAAGAVVVAVSWVRNGPGIPLLARPALQAGALLVVGVVCTGILLPNVVAREAAERPAAATLAPTAGSLASPGVPPGATPGSSTAPGPSPTTTPAPTATPAPIPDTVSFRLERVPIALSDLPDSPVIGFGAEAFGQRHPDRYAGAGPDHIAIMAVVVPYEAGLVGSVGLVAGFLLLLRMLWASARSAGERGDWTGVGTATAFAGAIVAMLVAYQVTNSLHFAINWMVLGAGLAHCVAEREAAST